MPTYFGGTTRHEMLERTVWHSTQHIRQIAALLEQVGIAPDAPLTARDTDGRRRLSVEPSDDGRIRLPAHQR